MNSAIQTVLEFLKLFVLLHLHFLILAGGSVLANKKLSLSDEMFRKMLHITAVFAIIPIVLPSAAWGYSAAVCAAFTVEAFIGMKYSGIKQKVGMKERAMGEQQRSMFLLFAVYIFVIAVGWGLFKQKWMPVLSVVAWGVGDCFAALVGKRFGRHKLRGKHIEGTKSVEGTVAMFITSFIATYAIYQGHTQMSRPWIPLLVSTWIAFFSCMTELFSKHGLDTVFCPLASLGGLVVLTMAAGGI